MSNCGVKDSIVRLRELRNQLCEENKDPSNSVEAYKARDFIIEHIQELHCMIVDKKVKRKTLEQKSSFILDSLRTFLEPCAGDKK